MKSSTVQLRLRGLMPGHLLMSLVAAVPIARKILEAAPDRVLWGTDFPHPNATHEADEADLVDLLPRYASDALAQRRLLVDNPARLYGFE